MKISEIIKKIKEYSKGESMGKPCNDERDKILYGEENQECTGIVTSVFASLDVIKKAADLGANLIVVNESSFWSHGDPLDWLQENGVFLEKKKLLDQFHITIWRYHEYIRSGVPYEKGYRDPINYGFAKKMGWLERRGKEPLNTGLDDQWMCLYFEGESVEEIALSIKKQLGLNGIQIVGDATMPVHTLYIPPGSIMGYTAFDNQMIRHMEENQYDCIIGLELVDYTLAEYIRDSTQSGHPRAIIHVGHFNFEEPGMEYAAEFIPEAIQDSTIPIYYVNSKDPYQYIVNC